MALSYRKPQDAPQPSEEPDDEQDVAETVQEKAPEETKRAAPTVDDVLAQAPPAAADWLRRHPEYLSDQSKNQDVQAAHALAARQTGEEYTARYFQKLEELLGMRSAAPPQAPRPAEPALQKKTPLPNYAAPVSRQPPTLSGQRPMGRMQLTQDELQIATASGQTPEEYARAKEMLLRDERMGDRWRGS